MTTKTHSEFKRKSLPPFTISTLVTVLLAGATATTAFDFFGKSLSPMLGFATLSPVPLANSVIRVVTGDAWAPGANFLHYFAGVVAYPSGWILVARPMSERITPILPWIVTSALYGIVLWVFALYFMAHLVAGNPPFLNFSGITWVALVGHVLFAVVAAWVINWRETS
ncbi:hypothetical protein ABVF61_30940 [Roseibium sp. HPY-6]|uniref:hypothetical protein n=1 Tax=Roseibium sp. HPY-6 TaxID=3229852 RepID=UPI00338F2116